MQRRDFLNRGLAAMLAAGAAPAAITARDKSGIKPVTIGAGEHKYECHHNWGALPKKLRWETTHGVCVDAEGLIYIKQQGLGKTALDTIFVFDKTGKFVQPQGRDRLDQGLPGGAEQVHHGRAVLADQRRVRARRRLLRRRRLRLASDSSVRQGREVGAQLGRLR
jgi:hypothetical protein